MQVQHFESVSIDYKDARYPNTDQVLHLSLKDAHELLKKLSEVLGEIPY